MAPVLWFLWRQRRNGSQMLGVTDVLLLAAVGGAGFGWIEDASIRHNSGWPSSLAWLPTTEIVGDRHGSYLIAGHIIWTGLAGLTLGLGLLLRGPRLQMMLIGASGWLWSVIDHAGNNYGNHYRDGLSATLRFITANGWLTAYIFVLGVCLAVALDFYLAYVAVPSLPEAKLPSWPASWAQAQTAWRFLRLRRQFAYALARYRRASGLARARAASVAADVDVTLVNWQLWQAASGSESRPT